MASDKETLLEFGFPEYKVDKALKVTKNSGLQAALDWLDSNGDNEAMFKEEPEESVQATSEGQEQANCLQCNDCGKLFTSVDAAQIHAARLNHSDFSESPITVASQTVELTAEEKAARLAALREKLAAKRALEASESLKAEQVRRESQKELERARREMEQKELQKLAEERMREKKEDLVARERIKRQIEEDRRIKKERDEMAKRIAAGELDDEEAAVTVQVPFVVPTINASSADHARIQVRLPPPDHPLKLTFEEPSTVTVGDLKKKITEESGIDLSAHQLMQTFPTRVFSGPDDDKLSLVEAGLCPSATLMIK